MPAGVVAVGAGAAETKCRAVSSQVSCNGTVSNVVSPVFVTTIEYLMGSPRPTTAGCPFARAFVMLTAGFVASGLTTEKSAVSEGGVRAPPPPSRAAAEAALVYCVSATMPTCMRNVSVREACGASVASVLHDRREPATTGSAADEPSGHVACVLPAT